MIFQNRKQAGELLAAQLLQYENKDGIVLALPRGGVPVAAEIARALNWPLEILAVRKIGAPYNDELAVGAICEDEEPVYNMQILSKLGLSSDEMNPTVIRERVKIKNQIQDFRKGKSLDDLLVNLKEKTILIVDDGLATGATVKSAIKYLQKKGVIHIVLAVPVSPTSTVQSLRDKVDQIVVLEEEENIFSVGQWYKDFSQVSDNDVKLLLKESTGFDKISESFNKLEKISNFKEKSSTVLIKISSVILEGELTEIEGMKALIIFAHGSGSSRKSPRNLQVAQSLNKNRFGTLLFDLLTEDEAEDRKNVFAIDFLSKRLADVTLWAMSQTNFKNVKIGYFGASTGAAGALQASVTSSIKDKIFAIVSRGGRPDLAGLHLKKVTVPTLLIVGANDAEVLELNRKAQKLISNSELSIIPKATHLFEESGTLEQVSDQAINWFNEHLVSIQGKVSVAGVTQKTYKKLESAGSQFSLEDKITKEMIKVDREEDFEPLIESIKNARVVMLGESTHGTQEYYRIRSQISQNLIKNHGFKFIAVEGDWPAIHRLHQYIQTGKGGSAKSILLQNHRWPTWMWANEEIVELVEELKNKNVGFHGLDIYSLFESIDEVMKFLKRNHPLLIKDIERLYACFSPFHKDEMTYARSIIKHAAGCEREVQIGLEKLLKLRIKNVEKNSDDFFSAQQNAFIIANAENYYRSMMGADSSSWNIRDGHMMETLDRLLQKAGEGAKAIVWAHNTHIGDYRATDMKANGYINLGGLARLSYGDENVALVGFGSYQGSVLAGSAWGGPEKIMNLPPAHLESYENYFHQVSGKTKTNQYYIIFNNENRHHFTQTLGHRAVGVVYNPDRESRGNYVPTELSKRYDSFVYINQTKALKSLHVANLRGEIPETWPSGV